MNRGRRGRPLGYRLSESSKRSISQSKSGQRHSQETKDKISRTLMLYFRRLNPLSDEIEGRYCRADDDNVCGWMNDVREDIDNIDDVLTSRSMRNTRKIEITYGVNIESFSHDVTPEKLLEIKEECRKLGLDVTKIIDNIF